MLLQQVLDQRAPGRLSVGIGDAQFGQRARHACHVLFKAKQFPLVNRRHLVDAVTKNKTPVQHTDLGLVERQGQSVEVAWGVGQGVQSIHG